MCKFLGAVGAVLLCLLVTTGHALGRQGDDAAQAAETLDRLLLEHAEGSGVTPAPLCDDATFLRRASLDLIGRIPTRREAMDYRAQPAETRRVWLIDQLVNHDRFVDRWAIFFDDLLQVRFGQDGGSGLARFIRKSLRENTPYDQMVAQLITAQGTPQSNPATGLLVGARAEPLEMAGIVSQMFLGVRMKCAQCHDHPYDVWTQDDYYDLAAYFGRTGFHQRNEPFNVQRILVTERPQLMALDKKRPAEPAWPYPTPDKPAATPPQESEGLDLEAEFDAIGSDEGNSAVAGWVSDQMAGFNENATGAPRAAHRERLAALVTHPDNPYFAQALVNRVWKSLLGRSFVEPVDDFRFDNPPSHPAVLEALGRQFVDSGYDFKRLVRSIVLTQAYQRALPATDGRGEAADLFLAARLRRLPAEALYDSLITAGHLDNFKHPAGEHLAQRTVRVEIEPEEPEQPMVQSMAAADLPTAESATMDGGGGSQVVEQREIDFASIFEELSLPWMGMLSPPDLARLIAEEATGESRRRYRYIVETYDDNPRFAFATTLRSPAPPEHFLRLFGQPPRELLGQPRDNEAASMRQALLLLNGELANQAARVGPLEPLGQMLINEDRNKPVVKLLYREVLTREPTEAELAAGVSVLDAAEDRAQALADLRWALLNSHEFRFYP